MSEEEFEKQTLDNLITDLRDIDKYTSFKNGAFIYDLGKYQGTLLVNHIEQLQQELKDVNDSITWWTNRFKAVQRDYEELTKRNKELEDGFKATTDELCEYATKLDKAIEYIKSYLPNYDFDHSNLEELLEILGDKEK